LADLPRLLVGHLGGAAPGARGAVVEAAQIHTLALAGLPPASHPLPAGRLKREPVLLDELDHAMPALRGERGVSVLHPGLLEVVSFENPQPLGGPGSTSWRSERPWARPLGRGAAGALGPPRATVPSHGRCARATEPGGIRPLRR